MDGFIFYAFAVTVYGTGVSWLAARTIVDAGYEKYFVVALALAVLALGLVATGRIAV